MIGSRIARIFAREILDSRGNPTIACRVILTSGASAEARVPSGASTGTHEALELRDGGKRYGGKGVKKAVKNVNETIAKALVGKDATKQQKLDELMIKLDGTANKSKLGANAILGVSLALAQAVAVHRRMPLWKSLRKTFAFRRSASLPVPTMNVLNGGAHAGWSLDVQECMIVPRMRGMAERVRAGSEVFHALESILREKGHETTVGDEGGFAPRLKNVEAAFDLLLKAIAKAGYRPGTDIAIAADVASSELYDKRKRLYQFRTERRAFTPDQLLARYRAWQEAYPIVSIEDGFAEDDWDAWKKALPKLGRKSVLVGDDFFVTNVERLKRGIDEHAANAILIKLNQIGTLTETVSAIEMAHAAKFAVSVSHRSGETADTTIADLAVASGAEFIKTGSLSRSDRVEKYNRLMEIEREMT